MMREPDLLMRSRYGTMLFLQKDMTANLSSHIARVSGKSPTAAAT